MNRFEGKVVIVTGAGSGIGAGTARRFSGKAHSSSSMDGVNTSCNKPSKDSMQRSPLFTLEMSRMRST